MASTYLHHFPKPLLDDLVAGQWLPVVGAGFSKNAVLPNHHQSMPLWNELGKKLADEMNDYDYVNPLDAVSAFDHEFGRPKLVERLSELVYAREAQPGEAHKALCSVPFDIVCTTNFDFLLEAQYSLTPLPYTPLVDEDQLSINFRQHGVAVLKLHGDLNHPSRLIVTEEDYDAFLDRYPVIATYLANLLITRTAVLVGYSLEDPDFRQVWQVVGERLGRGRRSAYVLCVGARSSEVARFERRGVKVINLAEDRNRYGEVLATTFDELRAYWNGNAIVQSQAREEESLRELLLPQGAATRLCFFAVPGTAQPFYREHFFPMVRACGLVPVTADEFISPSDNVFAKIDALIARAGLVVVDWSTQFTRMEAGIAFATKETSAVCVVVEEGASVPLRIMGERVIRRPHLASVEEGGAFVEEFGDWVRKATMGLKPVFLREMDRLYEAKEYRAAVISAITSLEASLRERMDVLEGQPRRMTTIRRLLQRAQEEERLSKDQVRHVLEWLNVRNEVVHSHAPVTREKARAIVKGVGEFLDALS